jgi:glycosyltransferase involved in cell wall biosynthesis
MRFLRMADLTDNRTGGATRFMHYSADELRADGHEVDCVFRDGLGACIEERLRRFVMPLRMVDIVRRRRREGRIYDAVEIHEPSGAAYALARQIDRRLPPMVLLSHGLEHRAHAAMLTYYRKKGIRTSLKRRYSPYSVIAQADLALRLADQVTVLNTEDRAYLQHRLGIARDRITIVNSGITQTFLRAPEPDEQARGVLFLGSWIDRKGTLDVVPALKRVLEARSDVSFTVAGFGGQIDVAQLFPRQFRDRVHQIPRVANLKFPARRDTIRPIVPGSVEIAA